MGCDAMGRARGSCSDLTSVRIFFSQHDINPINISRKLLCGELRIYGRKKKEIILQASTD